MSVVAGVLAFDGAPVAEEQHALQAYARRYGAVSIVSGSGVTLFANDTFVTRDDAGRVRTAVAIDGRVDVLQAYERNPHDFAGRLIGDFAFALWDEPQRTLFLARDAFGSRPLYWHGDAKRLVWASHLAPLLGLAREPLSIDRDSLAAFVIRGAMRDRTPVAEIRSVRAAELCVVRDGVMQRSRHWSLDPHATVDVRSDAEAEEKLRALLSEAVRSMTGDGPASVLLSGGVDSSSIVAVADAVRPEPPVQTISWVFEASPTSDEREFVRAVETHRGRRGVHIGEREQALLEFDPEDPGTEIPTSYVCFARRCEATRAAMRAAGSRVLLTGIGGDDVLYGDFGFIGSIADALARGRVLRALSEVRKWAPHVGVSHLQLLWRSGIRPLSGAAPVSLVAPWWSREFVERMHDGRGWPSRPLPSRRFDLQCFEGLVGSMARRWYFEHDEIVTREPFLYRPLVEYCFALPFEQKLRPGATRSILRRALRDLLPPAILTRLSKCGPDEALLRAAQRRAGALRALFAEARVVRHGFADGTAIDAALTKIAHGFDAGVAFLLRLIALELWLRWFERRPLSSTAAVTEVNGGIACTSTKSRMTSTKSRPSSSSATPPT
ncbi:MAG TPA: asparagine synthase-related protein [Thermoanaerobaculia bacterium]|nr:asparagine synthase-related protein [Thermoanaerobaculia bacterium]